MEGRSSVRSSLAISYALGLVAGVTVAIVLQDASVVVPFLILPLPATVIVHGLRQLSSTHLWRLAAASVVTGTAAILYGALLSDNGTVQALGVLGGAAMVAVGALTAIGLAATARFDVRPARR